MRSPVADDEEASYSDDFDEYEYEDDFEEEEEVEEDIEVEERVSSPPPSTSTDGGATGERKGSSDKDSSPLQTPTETLLPPRTASILMDLVSGRRSRRVRPTGAEEASITYAALLPNVETWALGGDLGGSRATTRGFGPVKEGEKGADEEVFQRYVMDRLAIERLTLSMRNYEVDEEEVEGRLLRTSAGLSRMVEVVRRKTAERFSERRVRDLYDHVHLIADIAESMPR